MATEEKVARSNIALDVWEKDRAHVLHPWTHFDSFKEEGSLIIGRGEGLHLTDVNGNRYLDAVGGLWCTNIGLGREELANAIADQVRTLTYSNPFVDMGSSPAALLAARLAELAPGDIDHVLFTTGGSTAVEAAVRIAQFYQRGRGRPEKRHLIVRRQSYHGATFLTSSLTGKDQIPEFEYERSFIHFVSSPNPYRRPEGLDEQGFCDFLIAELAAKIDELGAENISAFLAEPIQGAGGVIVPPAGYLKRAWELCRAKDILFIADEVVTGFGRLGHWFASEGEFGIQPDIITCAKGLTAGYLPLGACLYSRRLHEAMADDPVRFFGMGFTYGAHPVSCAAASKVIEILERERLFDHVNDVGPYFEATLGELRDLPIVGDVRGRKLMMGIEFVADRETKSLLPEEVNVGKLVSNRAEAHGLIVRTLVHLNIMSPSLTIERGHIDFIGETLRRSIIEVADQLVRDGHRLN